MEVYIGIDWSEQKHDVLFMNPAGQTMLSFQMAHHRDGFLQLEEARQELAVSTDHCLIGIETAHNLVIDFLWAWGYYQVYELPPSAVNRGRDRFKQSRARTDQSDAWVIADLLRTDLPNFHPWYPDSPLTRQIRAQVGLVLSLTRESLRLSNQLRAVLLRYYPTALRVFSGLDAFITLEFVRTYPNPQAAVTLSLQEFRTFAQQHRYPRPDNLPKCFARLQANYPQTDPATVIAFQSTAVQLAGLLIQVLRAKQDTLNQLQDLFWQHPDCEIYHSLPGAGDLLEPALLAHFGDDRRRFPTPAVVQALAGTCPVTDASGKRRRIYFRLACDHDFRYITQQWARASRKESDWAAVYYQQARLRGHSKSHALRCLANRWLAILWRLWQDRSTYDEAYHQQQRLLHSRPR
jgi:transposase